METHFGLEIKKLIERRGETYEQSARRLPYSKTTIFNMTKKRDLSTKNLRVIAKAYSIELSAFFAETNTYTQTSKIKNRDGTTNSTQSQNNEGTNKDDIKDERIRGLENEIKLLREMIEILKK